MMAARALQQTATTRLISTADLDRARAARDRLRARMEAAVERLLAALDAIDGDPDAEPSLGAPEPVLRGRRGGDQRRWSVGAGDDREADRDLEPYLTTDGVSMASVGQRPADDDECDDLEQDRSDDEPSLGWPVSCGRRDFVDQGPRHPNGLPTSGDYRLFDDVDQDRLSAGGTDDIEQNAEDEGAQCDDEGWTTAAIHSL